MYTITLLYLPPPKKKTLKGFELGSSYFDTDAMSLLNNARVIKA
jgi:hypothetical protein